MHRAGDIAQLARAAALQAVGQEFKPPQLHQIETAIRLKNNFAQQIYAVRVL